MSSDNETWSKDSAGAIAQRKGEHLQLAAEADVETRATAGWEDVHLIHDALPVIDAASIDLTTKFLGHTLRMPLVISGTITRRR